MSTTQMRLEVTRKGEPGSIPPTTFQAKLPINIGSLSTNALQLNGPGVSRLHARIEEDAGKIVVVDQSSATGTFVNNRAVGRDTIDSGSVIVIGDHVLTVAEVGDLAPPVGETVDVEANTSNKSCDGDAAQSTGVDTGIDLSSVTPDPGTPGLEPVTEPEPDDDEDGEDEIARLKDRLNAARAGAAHNGRVASRAIGIARFYHWCATKNYPAPTLAHADEIAVLVDQLTAMNHTSFDADDVFVVAASLIAHRARRQQAAQEQQRRQEDQQRQRVTQQQRRRGGHDMMDLLAPMDEREAAEMADFLLNALFGR